MSRMQWFRTTDISHDRLVDERGIEIENKTEGDEQNAKLLYKVRNLLAYVKPSAWFHS